MCRRLGSSVEKLPKSRRPSKCKLPDLRRRLAPDRFVAGAIDDAIVLRPMSLADQQTDRVRSARIYLPSTPRVGPCFLSSTNACANIARLDAAHCCRGNS
jgi:hypothetical protein